MSHDHHIDYKKIYYTLLVLLVISVAGPFLEIQWVTLLTAFGIAGVKAWLVVQNFMHLKVEKMIVKWFLAASVVLMALYFFGVAPDVMEHEGQNWVNVAAQEAVARGIPDEEHAEDDHAADEDHAEEGGTEPGGTEGGEMTAAAGFDAAAAYATVCSLCHGETGGGDGPGGAAMDPRPADFTDAAFWDARTDERVALAIKEGAVAVGGSPLMAPWGALYDDAQIGAMVEYLKTFRQ